MSELKSKQVFNQPLNSEFADEETRQETPELNAQTVFEEQEKFVPAAVEQDSEQQGEPEKQLEQVIRPSRGRKWLASGMLTAFAGLVGWQAIDSVVTAIQTADWLSLGWAGFMVAIASLGLGAMGKELWKLRSLRNHFSVQEQSEVLLKSDSVGKGKAICELLAHQGGIISQAPSLAK